MRRTLGTLAPLALAALPAAAQVTQDARLYASDGIALDAFGAELALEGPHALVGAPRSSGGAVYVFERDASGQWTERQQLRRGSHSSSRFGEAIALHGASAWIGNLSETHAAGAGVAYAYARAADGSWEMEQRLLGNGSDVFGDSVAVFGDRALVGAPKHSHMGVQRAGQVHVYGRDPGGGWSQRALLRAGDEVVDLRLGIEVALYGRRALAASALQSVYVFEELVDGTWIEVEKLEPPAPALAFGTAVALGGERALVGARRDSSSGLQEAGSAFLYERGTDGAWSLAAHLSAPDALQHGFFGISVALFGPRALVGAVGGTAPAHAGGAGYVFERQTDGSWMHTVELVGSDHEQNFNLGSAAALSGNRALLGDESAQTPDGGYSGAAFVYELEPGASTCPAEATSTGAPAQLAAVGSASLATNRLTFAAAPVPPLAAGIFFLGPGAASVPFGNGTLCVQGPFLRLPPAIAQGQVLERAVDLAAPPFAGQIAPGSTWHVQAWFRDVPAGGAFFDLSSALSIRFER